MGPVARTGTVAPWDSLGAYISKDSLAEQAVCRAAENNRGISD